jgi:cell division protein FtsL
MMINEQKLARIRKRSQVIAVLSLIAFFGLIGYSAYKLVGIRRDIADLEKIREERKQEVANLNEEINGLRKSVQQEAERSKLSVERVVQSLSAVQAQAIPPRIYLQINDESQRAKANRVADLLQKQQFIVPGIENVSSKGITTRKTDVRYYASSPDSAADVSKIKAALSQFGLTPTDIKLPENSSGRVRPRHYEVWLGTDF